MTRKKANSDLGPEIKALNQSLRAAARAGSEGQVKHWLAQGADVNSASGRGNTALHFAAWRGAPSVVNLLLGAGAYPNKEQNDGQNPLWDWAIGNSCGPLSRNRLETGLALLLAGTNPCGHNNPKMATMEVLAEQGGWDNQWNELLGRSRAIKDQDEMEGGTLKASRRDRPVRM
jgi:ankyrin repeat protein